MRPRLYSRDAALPLKVFISYPREDSEWRNKVVKYLSLPAREGLIEIWSDIKLSPGEPWNERILTEIEESDIVLLLVTASFFESSYCLREANCAMDCHEKGHLIPVPVPVMRYEWHTFPLARFNTVPPMNTPLQDWNPEAHGLNEVAVGMRRLATVIRQIRRGDVPMPAELAPRVLSRAALAQNGEATTADIIDAATRSEEHLADLEIERQRREESGRTPSRAESTRNREAIIRSLPDLLNRESQAALLGSAICQAWESNRSAPFAVVAEGGAGQAPEALIRRLKSDILPRELPELASMSDIPIYRVPWPQAARGKDAFEYFRPFLASGLSQRANAGREHLEAELTRQSGITIVHTTVDGLDWRSDSSRLVHSWFELWDGWRRIDSSRFLVVALLVRYASSKQPREGADQALEATLNETLNAGFSGIYLHRVEPPLGPVRRSHIDEWLDQAAVKSLPRSLRSRIAQWARELFRTQTEIPMEDAMDFLADLFDDPRARPAAG
jgi:hypothetical protein